MTDEPLLTVIVAVYRTEEFFERCLNSLLQSEYKNLEILLIDDGSPDKCPQLCDEYAKKDSRINVVHKENGGAFSARNMGIDIASGKYLAICDSDDMVPPEGYKKLMETAVKTNADIVQGTVRRTNQNTGDVRLWKRKESDGIKTKLIGFQGAIYRTGMLRDNKIQFQPFQMGEDISFVVQALNYADKVQYIENVTYEYLIRPVNAKGKSAIQTLDFSHYYDEFRWRCWVLEYIAGSKKLAQRYEKQLGVFCMIVDERWMELTEEQRKKCFDLLKRIVSCIHWEKDTENIKGYLHVNLGKFNKMGEKEYTKYLYREYKYFRPVKDQIKKRIGKIRNLR